MKLPNSPQFIFLRYFLFSVELEDLKQINIKNYPFLKSLYLLKFDIKF